MRNTFSGFYTLQDNDLKEIFESDSTIFIFDTSVLLNLYSYTKKTRDDFFSILEKFENKIWIPYHVGLEFQLQRLTIIKNEKAVYKKLQDKLNSIEKIFQTDIKNLNLGIRSLELNTEIELLENNIKDLLKNFEIKIDKFDKNQPCVRSSDEIRKKLDELFFEKIGKKPSQQWLNDLYKLGKERYEQKMPPGYMDEKNKKERNPYNFDNLNYTPMYGDLVIWKQIIEKAKDENLKNIIFISDDAKEDWIFSIDSNGKKDIGVRAELRQEIQKESGVHIFEIYTSSTFMSNINQISTIKIDEKSINEIRINTEIDIENNKEFNKINFTNKNSISDYIKDISMKYDFIKEHQSKYNYDSKNELAQGEYFTPISIVNKIVKRIKLEEELLELNAKLSNAIKNDDEDEILFYTQIIAVKSLELEKFKN